MKQKILLGVSALFVVGVMAIGSTLAYFTASDQADNVITTGSVAIAVKEYSEKDGIYTEYTDPDYPIVPGDTVSKIVKIQNTGTADAFIRAKIDIDAVDGTKIDRDQILCSIGDDWTASDDGYYYYNKILSPDEYSGALMDSVSFDTSIGNELSQKEIHININAQAIQSRNNVDNPWSAFD